MYNILLIIVILLLLISITNIKKKNKNLVTENFIEKNGLSFLNSTGDKPFLWIYLENTYNCREWKNFYSRKSLDNIEPYIISCIYSILVNNQNDFNIIILNEENIRYYLPDLKECTGANCKNSIRKRLCLISMMLLTRYGGIWLPPSTICFKNLKNLYNLTNNYDYISVSCSQNVQSCSKYNFQLDTNIVISKKNNKLFNLILTNCVKRGILNKNDYDYRHEIEEIFYKTIRYLKNYQEFNYFEIPAQYIGSTDNWDRLITIDNLLSSNRTVLKDSKKILFMVINREDISRRIKYNWFERFSIEQIFNSNLWITYLFRKALHINERYFNNNNQRISIPPVNMNQLYELIHNSNMNVYNTRPGIASISGRIDAVKKINAVNKY